MDECDGLALNQPVLSALGHSLLHRQHDLREREPRRDGGERAACHAAKLRGGVTKVHAPGVLPEWLSALALLLSDDGRGAAPFASHATRGEGKPACVFSVRWGCACAGSWERPAPPIWRKEGHDGRRLLSVRRLGTGGGQEQIRRARLRWIRGETEAKGRRGTGPGGKGGEGFSGSGSCQEEEACDAHLALLKKWEVCRTQRPPVQRVPWMRRVIFLPYI